LQRAATDQEGASEIGLGYIVDVECGEAVMVKVHVVYPTAVVLN
jgi:hypothetical protein